jgi:hypothetical protein
MKNFINIIKGDFMKRQVRLNVFETNSSMTHSLTMCTDSEYCKWKNDEVYWQRWDENFITVEEAKKEFEADSYFDDFEEWRREEGLLTYDEFNDYDYIPFETFYETYTTPNGETIHAFGYYGHD